MRSESDEKKEERSVGSIVESGLGERSFLHHCPLSPITSGAVVPPSFIIALIVSSFSLLPPTPHSLPTP